MPLIERKLMAHYINAAKPSETEEYVRLGKDLEEYSPSLNAEVEKKKNILGETSVKVSSYEKEGSVEPYYADTDDPLTERLQEIIDKQLVLDDVRSSIVDVHLWDSKGTNVYAAVKWPGMIEITSYGGDTTGYQIPFNFHYTGAGIEGTFSTSTKVFTASASV